MEAEIISQENKFKELPANNDIDEKELVDGDQDQEAWEKKYADLINTEINKQNTLKSIDQYYKDNFVNVFSVTIIESNLTEDQAKETISKLTKYYESLSQLVWTSDAFEQMYVFDRLNWEWNKEVAKTVVNNLDSFNELLSFNDKWYTVFSTMTLLKFATVRTAFNNTPEFRKDLWNLLQMWSYIESKIDNEESWTFLVSHIKHFLEMWKYLWENSKEWDKTQLDTAIFRILNTEKLRTIFDKNPDKVVKLLWDISQNVDKKWVELAIRESFSNESRMVDALERVISDNDSNEYESLLNVYISISQHASKYDLEEANFKNLSEEWFRSTVRDAVFWTWDDKINAVWFLSSEN